MKNIILSILGISFTLTCYGQLESGNILLGGEIAVSNEENQIDFSFSPTAYYFITDQLALGGDLSFFTSKNDLGPDNYRRFNSFGISPSLRYFWSLTEKTYVYGRGSIGFATFTSTEFTGNTSEENFTGSQLGVSLGTGIMYTLTPRFSIDLGLNLVGFSRLSQTRQIGLEEVTTNSNGFRFGLDTFSPSFGLYYVIK